MINLILALSLLPTHLLLGQPFPTILTQAPEQTMLAPGVEYEHISMLTTDGPIEVRVVATDLRIPSVHLSTVLAENRIISSGETVRSIALRSSAVAAINGDYFDLGHTNQPLGLTIIHGSLVRIPRKRYALILPKHGTPYFAEESLSASVVIGNTSNALSDIDAYPPNGLSILTPAFGPVPPNANVTTIPLIGPEATAFGTFTAGAPADNTVTLPAGTYLVIGPSAYGASTIPEPGSTVTVEGDLAPTSLNDIEYALGGGPLLLKDGRPLFDPDGPNGFTGPIPSSGVGVTATGELLLVEVDGRQRTRSVGLTRAEFATLFLALGARDAMALDGGGSSTLVAQLPGDPRATVRNHPSDGVERRVGDALIVASTSLIGPATQLATRPAAIHAIVGAQTPLHLALLDANEHTLAPASMQQIHVDPSSLGQMEGNIFTAQAPGLGKLWITANGFRTSIPIEVVATPARLVVLPTSVDLGAYETRAFVAHAYDALGYRLTLPPRLAWSASTGTIATDGYFHAASVDSTVHLRMGHIQTAVTVRVGLHTVTLASAMKSGRFETYPRGGAGSTSFDRGSLTLDAELGDDERAAYAILNVALPAGARRVHLLVNGDGCGAVMRIALRDEVGTRVAVGTEAITWAGQREIAFELPASRPGPFTLESIYLLAHFGTHDVSGSCRVRIAALHVDVAGTGANPTRRQ